MKIKVKLDPGAKMDQEGDGVKDEMQRLQVCGYWHISKTRERK